MSGQHADIVRIALETLKPEEHRTSVGYLDTRVLSAGQPLVCDGITITEPVDVHVVFVDLEPVLNWGHAACYVLVPVESGDPTVIPASFPPYLIEVPPTLRLAWQGSEVPDWAVVDCGEAAERL